MSNSDACKNFISFLGNEVREVLELLVIKALINLGVFLIPLAA
jgi:hypothetical protein